MALRATLYADGRRDDRLASALASTMRDQSNSPIDIIIEDLSPGGFRCQSSRNLQAGALMSLGLPGIGIRPVRVVWTENDRYGCEFLTRLSAADLITATNATTVIAVDFLRLGRGADDEILVEKRKLSARLKATLIFLVSVSLWLMIVFSVKAFI